MNIAIIGAGPRGLSLCERLIAQASINQQSLSLTLIDPYPPGGAIWQTNQPQSLLLNSVTSQVTLFTDETLETGGPINPGPSLYEWAKKDGRNFAKKNQPSLVSEIDKLDPDGHCSRALYGLYQKWFYQQLIETLPPFITFTYLQENAIGLIPKQTHYLLKTQWTDLALSLAKSGVVPLSRSEAESVLLDASDWLLVRGMANLFLIRQ